MHFRRLIPFLLLVAGLRSCAPPAFAQSPVFPAPVTRGELSPAQLARIQQEDFVRTYNEFVEAANELIRDVANGLAPVKKARRVVKLFDKVHEHPGWPGGKE